MNIRSLFHWLNKHFILTSASHSPLSASMENWHEHFIEHLASIYHPNTYVELGLYQCELFNRIIPLADRLIGVDMELSAGSFMTKSPKTTFFHGTTSDYAETLSRSPSFIDMLFIDACHSEEAVWQDFWNFFPYVQPHGLILLHDAHPKNNAYTDSGYCGTAYKAVERLRQHSDRLEIMTIPVHPGLALCRKRTTQLSWMEEHN